MKITLSFMLILIIGLASSTMALDLDSLATEIMEELWSFHPIAATHLGIHKFDTQMPDYSKSALNKKLKCFKRLKTRLDDIDTLALSPDDLVDYHLLRLYLNDEIFDIETGRVYEQNPLLYVQSCINSVYTIMMRYAPSVEVRMDAVRVRLNQVPSFLETARQNLKNPSHILCDVAIKQLNEGEKFIEGIFTSHRDSLPPEKPRELQQATASAVAAMMHFAYWLEKNQDPYATYVLGKENYDYKLRNVHLIDIDSDSILRIGESYLERTTLLIDSLSGLLEPASEMTVTLPSDFGRKDVIEYRETEIRELRDFVVESSIVTVPGWVGEIRVVETPAFLSEVIPGVAMVPPGPFDESGTSYFYTPSLAVKFDLAEAEYFYNYIHNRWFRDAVVHEAYPGHHLQLSIASRHRSAVRRAFHDYFFIEGWALYCEELMAGSGLYEDTIGAMINALEGVRYRAARIIVDVNIQTGIFTYEDALGFMTRTFGGSESYYAREIKRYISNPIQPSSYLVGKLQILELRDEYKRLKGDDFELKEFHDALISHGSIPVDLIRRLLLPETR